MAWKARRELLPAAPSIVLHTVLTGQHRLQQEDAASFSYYSNSKKGADMQSFLCILWLYPNYFPTKRTEGTKSEQQEV